MFIVDNATSRPKPLGAVEGTVIRAARAARFLSTKTRRADLAAMPLSLGLTAEEEGWESLASFPKFKLILWKVTCLSCFFPLVADEKLSVSSTLQAFTKATFDDDKIKTSYSFKIFFFFKSDLFLTKDRQTELRVSIQVLYG